MRLSAIRLFVRDVDAAGVVFEAAPQQQAWGGRLATFRDADGNTLQLSPYG